MRLLVVCLVLFCCGCSRQSSLPPQAVAPTTVAPETVAPKTTKGDVLVTLFSATELEGKSGDTSGTAGGPAPGPKKSLKSSLFAGGNEVDAATGKPLKHKDQLGEDAEAALAHDEAKKRCPEYPNFDSGTDTVSVYRNREIFMRFPKKCVACHTTGGEHWPAHDANQ
jgi:hypothetical protein